MSFSDTDPVAVQNGNIELLQTCFTSEGEGLGAPSTSDSNYSDGSAASLVIEGDSLELDFTTGYEIPAGELGLGLRYEGTATAPEVEYRIDNTLIGTYAADTSGSILHRDIMDDARLATYNQSVPAGDHTFTVELVTANGGEWIIDVIAPLDKRFNYSFDNDNGGSSGYLDGPELYPQLEEIEFVTTETQRTITEANVASMWNDTSNNQYIELRIGSASFDRTNNSETASTTNNTGARSADVRMGLSRFGSRSTATPQTGFNGQQIQDYELLANPSAINNLSIGTTEVEAIGRESSIENETFREAAQLASDDTLLTRTIFAPVLIEAGDTILSSEKTGFNNNS